MKYYISRQKYIKWNEDSYVEVISVTNGKINIFGIGKEYNLNAFYDDVFEYDDIVISKTMKLKRISQKEYILLTSSDKVVRQMGIEILIGKGIL